MPGRQHQPDDAEEHPVPAGQLRHHAGGERPHEGRNHPGGGEGGENLGCRTAGRPSPPPRTGPPSSRPRPAPAPAGRRPDGHGTGQYRRPAVRARTAPRRRTAGRPGPRRSDQFPRPPSRSRRWPAGRRRPALQARPASSRLTTGMTVVTARDSNAARNTRAQAPTVPEGRAAGGFPTGRGGHGRGRFVHGQPTSSGAPAPPEQHCRGRQSGRH